MSACFRYSPEALERDREAAELARQLDRVVEGARRHHDGAAAARLQMARDELAHLAGADQHDRLVVESLEDGARQIRRDRRHRHRFPGDAGLGADTLGDRERAVEGLVEDRARGAGTGRRHVLLLHLPEDLRLADHHRIEARRDAEEMADRVAAVVDVEVGREGRSLDRPRAREERLDGGRDDRWRLGDPGDDLDAVAGREDRGLVHAGDRLQLPERGRQRRLREREPLA